MKYAVSNAVMRESDRLCIDAGTPAALLIQRAGEAIFTGNRKFPWSWDGRTAILCGTGNNGSDGLALALILTEHGYECTVFLAADTTSADGALFLTRCREKQIPIQVWQSGMSFPGFSRIADCLFGTGFHGRASGPAAEMIRAANNSGLPILSADIPSGLNGDNGLAEGDCIRADYTLSIGCAKYGHYLAMAKDFCGQVIHLDIGIPIVGKTVCIPEDSDFRELFPPRPAYSHKGNYGYVAVMGGCREYSGAIKLANRSQAALRCGCGVAKLITAESLLPAVLPHLLESTAFGIPDENGQMKSDIPSLEKALSGTSALAVGMGWGSGIHHEEILVWILENYPGRLILDADALNVLGRIPPEKRISLLRNRPIPTILTPHPMEFQRISGIPVAETAASPIETAMRYAADMHVILLLKGTSTIVTDGTVCYLVDRGCPGMATAGSGDVLSGILAGLCGWHEPSVPVTACGAYLAGLAGEMAQAQLGDTAMIASDTITYLPKAVRFLST